MRTGQVAIGIATGIALMATLAAVGMIWLLLTDPVRAVNVLQAGDLRLVLWQLLAALVTGARVALNWL